ncbi:MAG: (deoxy)nucleoside triphosphate pyrophosphohydrolase [Cytophagales bacterium]|nr:(deoxy)nucleoside triphosphate pyrophosphohydrolase [Cytophagales bacterium]MDW8384403.1 (deoxy)nucleoside triphosphate pyrophosphohydrolase [Flammeovirgaceae bacterium]
MPTIHVVCAVIIDENKKILALQRGPHKPPAYKWEFPGGKIEPNESEINAIRREIREELHLEIQPMKRLKPSVQHTGLKTIRLIPFACRIRGGTLTLTEHSDFKWIEADKLHTLDWAIADLPIVHEIQNMLKS